MVGTGTLSNFGFHDTSRQMPPEMEAFVGQVLRIIIPPEAENEDGMNFSGDVQNFVMGHKEQLFAVRNELRGGIIEVEAQVPNSIAEHRRRSIRLQITGIKWTPSELFAYMSVFLRENPITQANWKVVEQEGKVPNPLGDLWTHELLKKLAHLFFKVFSSDLAFAEVLELSADQVWLNCVLPALGSNVPKKNRAYWMGRHMAYLLENDWLAPAPERSKGWFIPGDRAVNAVMRSIGVVPAEIKEGSPREDEYIAGCRYLVDSHNKSLLQIMTTAMVMDQATERIRLLLQELDDEMTRLELATKDQASAFSDGIASEQMLQADQIIYHKAMARLGAYKAKITQAQLLREVARIQIEQARGPLTSEPTSLGSAA